MLAGATAGTLWYLANDKPIPRQYRSGLNFPLFYPQNLPHGYRVDRNSFQRQGKVLIFNLLAPGKRNMAVSEEVLPAGLDLTGNSNGPAGFTPAGQKNFTTAIGPAEYRLFGSHTIVSIVSQKTWIVINVTNIPQQTAIDVASSLQPL